MSDSRNTRSNANGVALNWWPRLASARWGLGAIMAFACAMALLLASTVPPWWGPDEDYHWNYVNQISVNHSLPDPREPFYSTEWNRALVTENFNQFGMAPAGPTALTGDPHAADKEYRRSVPRSERHPAGEATRPVMHAPLYHLTAALVSAPFDGQSVWARLWTARAANALVALLIVFAAWLLAAQVFAREGPRLLVAGLAATQPMINYSTGTATNDALLTACFTLVVAVLLRILARPPDPRQGRWLGVFLAAAVLAKSSALMLAPLAAIALLVQYLRSDRTPQTRRTALISTAWAFGLPALLAGWFYLILLIKFHSLTGALGAISAPIAAGTETLSLRGHISDARTWLQEVYSTYWFHYVYWEGPRGATLFYVPFFIGMTAIVGLVGAGARLLRIGAARQTAVLQALFLLAVCLLIMLPWFGSDMLRAHSFQGHAFNGGRFMLPAYPAAAALLVIGFSALLQPRVRTWAFSVVMGVAVWQSVMTWKMKTLDRYFGGDGAPNLAAELRRASFFRPQWVTGTSLAVLIVLTGLLAVTAWLLGVQTARRETQLLGPPGTGPLDLEPEETAVQKPAAQKTAAQEPTPKQASAPDTPEPASD